MTSGAQMSRAYSILPRGQRFTTAKRPMKGAKRYLMRGRAPRAEIPPSSISMQALLPRASAPAIRVVTFGMRSPGTAILKHILHSIPLQAENESGP